MKNISRIRLQLEEFLYPSSGDKVEYDPELKSLLAQVDRTKTIDKSLVEYSKSIVGLRRKKPNGLEKLGQSMHCAGRMRSLANTLYGQLLVKVGEGEEKLGQAEKNYILLVHASYIKPLEVFFRLNTKTIKKETSALEKNRLDLGVCKKAQRRATSEHKIITSLEKVKAAQDKFDRQTEMLQMMLVRVAKTHEQQLHHLKEFVQLQFTYFDRCNKIVSELFQDLHRGTIRFPT